MAKQRKMPLLAVGVAGVTVLYSSTTLVWAQQASGELQEFTAITAANIDSVKNMTFEGHKVDDLLTDRLEWLVRNHNLKVVPMHTPKYEGTLLGGMPYDPRVLAATEKYKGQARVTETFELENYTAGVPFPDVDMKDPQAGVKLVWNYNVAQPTGDQFWCPFTFNLIDGEIGLERVQQWTFSRYYLRGREISEPATVGDGSILHKSLIFARFPQDIKGLGTYTIRYFTPKLDDVWAYIRTVRRVRRLSGGAWMDPIGSTDHLQDDIETFNAHPSWYKQYKLLGRTYALVIAHTRANFPANKQWTWYPNEANIQDQYPTIDFETPPHWQPKDVFMVRPVNVIETVPPEYHPYTKKILYHDAAIYRPYYAETFDKRGDFWKFMIFTNRPYSSADGYIDPKSGKPAVIMFSGWGVNADYQRRHASAFTIAEGCEVNPPRYTEDDFSIAVLEAAGR